PHARHPHARAAHQRAGGAAAGRAPAPPAHLRRARLRRAGRPRALTTMRGDQQEGALEVAIRPMRREDLDELMEIENSAYRAPWSREVFLEEMQRGWAHVDVLRRATGGPLLAFVNYWIVGDEVHVLNVATHPEHRRRGLARRL